MGWRRNIRKISKIWKMFKYLDAARRKYEANERNDYPFIFAYLHVPPYCKGPKVQVRKNDLPFESEHVIPGYIKGFMEKDVETRLKMADETKIYTVYLGFLPQFENNGRLRATLIEEHVVGAQSLVISAINYEKEIDTFILRPLQILSFPDPSKLYQSIKKTFLNNRHWKLKPPDVVYAKSCLDEICKLWYERNVRGRKIPLEEIYKLELWLRSLSII